MFSKHVPVFRAQSLGAVIGQFRSVLVVPNIESAGVGRKEGQAHASDSASDIKVKQQTNMINVIMLKV